ncbi:MAG: HAMP domain-containing sensor histidine kinase [Planctomycetota bacterium]
MSLFASLQSLRFRLLGPIVFTAVVAAVIVALGSLQYSRTWAANELRQRFDPIASTFSNAAFPLNPNVVQSLAELTGTEWETFDEFGDVRYSTLTNSPVSATQDAQQETGLFIERRFKTVQPEARSDGVWEAAVYFDRSEVEADRRRTLGVLLLTGLSTVLGLTTVTLLLSSRLVGRLRRLKRGVEAVAAGRFDSLVSDQINDEVGRLGLAVDQMAEQLSQLWKAVNRQQGERVLHQIAGGLAHQLRNRLTGARMAVELHARQYKSATDGETDVDDGVEVDGLKVAIHEMEQSEDYVKQLLVVAAGRQGSDRPANIARCIETLQKSHNAMARHLGIQLHWNVTEDAKQFVVRDGPTWISAISNLIHNAMQAGKHVQVDVLVDSGDRLRSAVADDGPGIPDSMGEQVFEPFVTSKPEGVGLGLAVVRRAAERLGGEVRWYREQERTIFEMHVARQP